MSTPDERLAATRKLVKSQAFASLRDGVGALDADLAPGINVAAHLGAIQAGMAGLEAALAAASPPKDAPGWPAINLGTAATA